MGSKNGNKKNHAEKLSDLSLEFSSEVSAGIRAASFGILGLCWTLFLTSKSGELSPVIILGVDIGSGLVIVMAVTLLALVLDLVQAIAGSLNVDATLDLYNSPRLEDRPKEDGFIENRAYWINTHTFKAKIATLGIAFVLLVITLLTYLAARHS